MKKRAWIWILSWVISGLWGANASAGPIWRNLKKTNPDLVKKLQSGKVFEFTEESDLPYGVCLPEGQTEPPWPRVHVYAVLPGVDVMTVASVFANFESHRDFLESVDLSNVRLVPGFSNKFEVDYLLDLPVGESERYTVENTVERFEDQDGPHFRISWFLVEALSTLYSTGEIHFEKISEGQTLIYYKSFVIPGRLGAYGNLAGVIRYYAIAGMKAVVKDIRREVESQSASARAYRIEGLLRMFDPEV